MREIEFRRAGDLVEIVIDGVSLLDLVREAELPYARSEQLERAEEFAPEPAPLLAGAYSCFPGTAWPSRHYLGEPAEVAYNQEDDETMLLGCSCGIPECWALLARIEVTDTEVRWSGFSNNARDWDLSATLGPFVFSRRQYEQALRATARPAPAPAPPPSPVVHDDVRLVPVIDALSGAVHELTEDYPALPDDESLWDAYWVKRIAAAGLPKPMPDDPRLIPLSGFLTGRYLATLVRATLRRSLDGDEEGALDNVSCLGGGYCLLVSGKLLVAPGCCSDLTDLASWREAARSREPSPSMVWIGHPWLHVAADGDRLLLTGPTDRDDPGPELAWVSRQALGRAVQRAAAEVRYFARPLHTLCASQAEGGKADALCAALLGGSWLRSGGDWLD
ncbi:hypothetical protein ACQP2T_35170 [Nonomuraea sp. CA-143628]|uniref:hypothetical protein n=1 Tax=Nonomuraea sp. CA-143628 TaxID=3239997 RepID=UPI003D92BF26